MTQFSPTPRIPKADARLRRFAHAFKTFGGAGNLNVTHIFNNQGVRVEATGTGNGDEPVIQVEDDAGAVVVGISDTGVSSPDPNILAVNTNTTISSSVINQMISCDPAATMKITLSGASNLATGTWIGFQDVSGNAGIYGVLVDPNTSNSGFTLNGSSSPTTVLLSNYGTSYIRLLKHNGDKDWFLEQGAGALSAFGTIVFANTNTTMTYPNIAVFMNTNTGEKHVYVPDASLYTKTVIYVKKTTNDGNNFFIHPKLNSGQLIDGLNTIGDGASRRVYTLFSTGSDWEITGSHAIGP